MDRKAQSSRQVIPANGLDGAARREARRLRHSWPLLIGTLPALALITALALPGCAGHQQPVDLRLTGEAKRIQIDKNLPEDPAVEELIAPYRQTVVEKMSAPLAFAPVPFERDEPEGMLGALAADLVLARARDVTGLPVDACVLNNGGLRRALPVGKITLGLVYEVMPFDNEIVVLRFTAQQMQTLADQIAATGGEPVSGLSLTIAGGKATDVLVGGKAIEPRDYWVATSDYLAGGGGGVAVLWEAEETIRPAVTIRDALVYGLRAIGAAGGGGELGAVPVPEMGRIR